MAVILIHETEAIWSRLYEEFAMKRRLFASIVIVVMWCAYPAFSADYQKGVEAYQRGDYASALIEFNALAAQGSANAQFILGVMRERGLGVVKDENMAAKWYLLAARQGQVDAQYRLATLLESGTGTIQDFVGAVKWYRLAASEGLAAAQYGLGKAYHLGQGVDKDDQQARTWLRLAADQNVTDAQVMLGEMLFSVGLSPNTNVSAYMWMGIAASSGDVAAKRKKSYFSAFMTPDQLVQGERRMLEWKTQFEENANR